MSPFLVRLRRAIPLSSTLLTRQTISVSTIPNPNPNPYLNTTITQSRHFKSSPLSLSSSARSSFTNNNNSFGDEIGPDTILFEGCDYNHWLITMDFPKDPPPNREDMIEAYLQTLAKVVGSYEEAKKKMYAFSTTTYQGFQCLVSEDESQKFEGLPGVVFILPDSYIDPVNMEYGGDKYENGMITPRPPPMQYGRQGGRYGDRNGGFTRSNGQRPNEQGNRAYVNQGPRHGDNMNFVQQQNSSLPNHQGNQEYDNQGHRYGDNKNFNRGYNNQGPAFGDNRNSGQQQNHPVQPNYGPSGGERRNPLQMNNAPGGRDLSPPYQGNNYASPQEVTQGQGAGENYRQMGGGNKQGSGGNY